jgi:hypothetical protein
VVLLLLGTLFPVLFQHSLNFLLEDLSRPPLAVLILVALFFIHTNLPDSRRWKISPRWYDSTPSQRENSYWNENPNWNTTPNWNATPNWKPPLIGGSTPPYGQNIPPSLAQYWNQLIQHPPQSTGGQQFSTASVIPPSIGQPYPGTFNPIWGLNAQTHVPIPGYNPMSYYPLQPPTNLPGSSHYMQTTYGPTSLLMRLPPQSHQYPQVNR